MLIRALFLAHIRREPLRLLVTVLAVALGVALVLAIDLANATAVTSFTHSVNIVSRKVTLQVLGFGHGFDERIYARVQALPDMRAVHPIIEEEFVVGARLGNPFAGEILHVVGTDLLNDPPIDLNASSREAAAEIQPLVLLEGRGAFLSARIARRYHLHRGSILAGIAGDHEAQLRVVGIIPVGTVGIDSSVIFVDIVTAQELFHRVGQLDRLDLEVDPADRDHVAQEMKHMLPSGVRVITPTSRNAEIQRMLQSFQLNLQALGMIALLVGSFLIYNTVAMSVVQRQAEIGILRGLGASRIAILRVFLVEGLFCGSIGSLLGLLAGALLAETAVGAVTKTVATLYVAMHADGVDFTWLPFVKAFALGIAASLFAAFMPAREAAAILPVLSMKSAGSEERHSRQAFRSIGSAMFLGLVAILLARLPAIASVPVGGYGAGLAAIFAAVCLLPLTVAGAVRIFATVGRRTHVTIMLAAMHLAASRKRTSVAVAALMIAIGMTVAMAILVDSFRISVIAWAHDSLKADLYIRPLGFGDASEDALLDPHIVARLQRLPGVATVDTFRSLSIPYRGQLTSLGVVDFATLPVHRQLRFLGSVDIDALSRQLTSRADAVVSEPFATRFASNVGDMIELPTPSGPLHLRICAIYNDYSSDAGFVLIDRKLFRQYFHEQGIASAAIYAQPGVDLAGLRTAALRAALPSRIDVVATRELRGYVVTVFNHTFAITNALYIITIATAVLGVMSTLFALVLERKNEIGVLRYLGVSVQWIGIMVLSEAAVIGLLGGVSGVLLGIVLALDLIKVINRQAFGWLIELVIPWTYLADAILLAVFAAVIAGIWPASIAAKMQATELHRRG